MAIKYDKFLAHIREQDGNIRSFANETELNMFSGAYDGELVFLKPNSIYAWDLDTSSWVLTRNRVFPTIGDMNLTPGKPGEICSVEGVGEYFWTGTVRVSAEGLNLDQTAPQTIINGAPYFSSGLKTNKIYPSIDSVSALKITKADGTTNILNVDSTNGRIGIGTTAPGAKLDIRSTNYGDSAGSNPILSLGDNTSLADWMFRIDATNEDLHIDRGYTSSYEVLTLQRSTGNVGIGTTSPAGMLTLLQAGDSELNGIRFERTGATRASIALSAVSGNLEIARGGTPIISVGTGNVGIGTTAPSQKLDVRRTRDGAINYNLYLANEGAGNGTGVGIEMVAMNSTPALRDQALISSAWIDNTAGSEDSYLAFSTRLAGSVGEKLRIDNLGNVGIGTTAPTVPLDVLGTTRIYRTATGDSAQFQIKNTADNAEFNLFAWGAGVDGTFLGTNKSDGAAFYGAGALNYFFGASNNAPIIFGTNDAEVMRITTTGLGIGVSPNSTLHNNGSFAGAYRAITALRTLDATDYFINCTANTFTVTLPTAVGITGREYIIKNTGTGIITIDTTSSQTIDGATTREIITMESVTVVSTGANWIII